MLKATKATVRMMSALALLSLPAITFAQSYYDDDIYYNPSKDKQKTTTKASKNADNYSSYRTPNELTDFPAADTYYVNTGSTRDVDEYNRRGQFLVSDSVQADTELADTYTNTRKIQRFHNGDVVNSLNDDDYATYVITDPAQVNIYIDANPAYSWLYPYSYSSYWRWNWAFGNPWWNVSWSILDPWYVYPSWGWGPSWAWGPSWSWGWGPSWAWGPSYGPGWGPGWGYGPGHIPGPGIAANRPTGVGSSRPHNYVGAGNNVRPVATTAGNRGTTGRPGNSGMGTQTSRPGNSGMGTAASRPGNAGMGTATPRPGNNGAAAPSNNSGSNKQGGYGTPRGRNNSSATQSSGSSNNRSSSAPARSNSSSNRSSSSSSYGRGSSSHSSGSSMSSGSRGGSMGGGSHSGGGGGGRGRR